MRDRGRMVWMVVGGFSVRGGGGQRVRERVAKIKHRGGGGVIATGGRGREREREREEHDMQIRERSSMKNRHIISRCRNMGSRKERGGMGGLGNLEAQMYTVHIRMKGRNLWKVKPRKPLLNVYRC